VINDKERTHPQGFTSSDGGGGTPIGNKGQKGDIKRGGAKRLVKKTKASYTLLFDAESEGHKNFFTGAGPREGGASQIDQKKEKKNRGGLNATPKRKTLRARASTGSKKRQQAQKKQMKRTKPSGG